MARRRFSLVLRGQRGAAAKQKYLDRLEGLGQGESIGTKGSRPASQKLYLEPFAADFPPTVLLIQSALAPAWQALGGLGAISARVKATADASDITLKAKGFRGSRVIRRTIDQTGVAATSKLTGLKYLKYNTTSLSVPFGRDNSTDTVQAARTAIIAAIGNGYNVSFTDEDV